MYLATVNFSSDTDPLNSILESFCRIHLDTMFMAKIMIVDDDPQAADQIASQLKTRGHSCAVMNDGEGVLEVARKTDLDLLILDVMLPSTSGFEVCRQVRRDDALYMLPILFVSSMNDEAEIQHGLEQGADGYIAKPIESQAFLQRV